MEIPLYVILLDRKGVCVMDHMGPVFLFLPNNSGKVKNDSLFDVCAFCDGRAVLFFLFCSFLGAVGQSHEGLLLSLVAFPWTASFRSV